MKKIIIGIHGLSNKPDPEVLKNWWIDSIKEGLTRIEYSPNNVPFEMVYWADILYSQPLDPLIKEIDDPLFLDEPYFPLKEPTPQQVSVLKTKLMQYIEDQLDSVFLNDDMSLNFEDVTDKIVHHYFVDLEKYYSNNLVDPEIHSSLLRNKIRSRLKDVLMKYKDYDILLIAHSMGSIIAYDVLQEIEGIMKISTLVTIGSPLGLPIIVSRIYEELKQKHMENSGILVPKSVSSAWYNLSDITDTVALDHTLQDDYKSSLSGVGVIDMNVYNDYIVEGRRNPHKSFGYLRTQECSAIIKEFLESKGVKWIINKCRNYFSRMKQKVMRVFSK